jgi:hypothetical protein
MMLEPLRLKPLPSLLEFTNLNSDEDAGRGADGYVMSEADGAHEFTPDVHLASLTSLDILSSTSLDEKKRSFRTSMRSNDLVPWNRSIAETVPTMATMTIAISTSRSVKPLSLSLDRKGKTGKAPLMV